MNNFYIPTYQEAQAIVEKTGTLVFYEMKQEVDGYHISHFNYRLAGYNDFLENNAKELRGLTFVFNSDGTVFRRYVLLHKFFNLNQVTETQYSLVKDTPIVAIHDKADGSVISFVKLPNGKVYAKSKMVVRDNHQAGLAQDVYEHNQDIKRLVNYALDNDLMPIFELVSPLSKVVLEYAQTDLVLIRLRVNSTGEYLPLDSLGDYLSGVTLVEKETHKTWDDILSLAEKTENKEGWVVTLPHDMIKLKTAWYFERHSILTDLIYRVDYLIGLVVDNKIDDLLGQLNEVDHEVRSLIDTVTERVTTFLSNTLNSTNKLVDDYYLTYNDRKAFGITYHKDFHFGFALNVIEGREAWDGLCDTGKSRAMELVHIYESEFSADARYVGDRKAFSQEYERDDYRDYFLPAHKILKERELFDKIKEDLKNRTYFLGNAEEFIRTGNPPKQ
jgi:T4 RnlA family RNA ligase